MTTVYTAIMEALGQVLGPLGGLVLGKIPGSTYYTHLKNAEMKAYWGETTAYYHVAGKWHGEDTNSGSLPLRQNTVGYHYTYWTLGAQQTMPGMLTNYQ